MRPRPLSPHVTVFRFQYTMIGSFTHRMTGVALSFGLIVLAAWLVGAAGGAQSYATVSAALGSVPCQVLLALWLLAFCYHFFNGIRHLAWDAGFGFKIPQVYASGYTVLALTVIATIIIWLVAMSGGAA